MNETPKNRKFGLLKCPFPLREQVIRNMEFMDAFHFSTLSKRSKQMVRSARYQTVCTTFSFEEDSSMDHIEIETSKSERLKISLSNLNDLPKRNQNSFDGLKLASLINEPSDDYRRKLSAHLLFIFDFEEVSVHIERNIEHAYVASTAYITPEYLQFVLNATKAKEYYMDFKMDDLNFKYQLNDCEFLDVSGSVQWLDTDGILQRNPQMEHLHLEELQGGQINGLLKQWINGQVTDLESLAFFNWDGYPNEVILDGIVTMETKLTEDQAIIIFLYWNNDGRTVDIQRKIDGQIATVHINHLGCYVHMWHESELSKL
ncbi:hypothetical protein B9Z55_015562 [Caenorhabditis nigoni]|uniref:F-box domain-containing protein n=1 Tax=Caenorhabditis nigoni TaxID=1611254 RepID=A0A2G5UAT1_9PELO|nr:hypothetical protein B9Z55_015562 [Caenorhabditis nigoni]